MPADQLFTDGVERIVDAEFAFFSSHFGEEDRLQHQVAELFGQIRPIALVDGVQHLVSFFDQIRLNGVEVLFPIPGAAAGRTQPRHDRDQALESFPGCGSISRHFVVETPVYRTVAYRL